LFTIKITIILSALFAVAMATATPEQLDKRHRELDRRELEPYMRQIELNQRESKLERSE
jgi:hypothetical protein